ncbi:MAG: glycosyltransferase family 1 protein [Spirulina sp. SIO3F2]|nr:glycosyltransferase family 1 protein [Spirulina sp. SIO3F2]
MVSGITPFMAACPYHHFASSRKTFSFNAKFFLFKSEVMSDQQNVQPRLQLINEVEREGQNGWGVVLESLQPLLTVNPVLQNDSVLLDSFIEASFGPRILGQKLLTSPPYNRPWIGFAHNPPAIPQWHEYQSAPQQIITLDAWQASLNYCRGIVTFSQYLRDWYLEHVPGIAITALKHPTATPCKFFDLDAYRKKDSPKVVQVGWWLRRLNSIYELPINPLKKAILQPTSVINIQHFQQALTRELETIGYAIDTASVQALQFLNKDDYEDLLSKVVVFIHLYDASANNTIVECIARNTPLLVNPLPAVIEYLGSEYPLYFSDLEEAAQKVSDIDLIEQTWHYLKNLPKGDLTCEFFYRSFTESAPYKGLDKPHL